LERRYFAGNYLSKKEGEMMKKLMVVVLLTALLSGCSSYPPEPAQTALAVIFGKQPIAHAHQAKVKGFAEYWCVVMGSADFAELGSVQILTNHDGGWNASIYKSRVRWESNCGPVPAQFESNLHAD